VTLRKEQGEKNKKKIIDTSAVERRDLTRERKDPISNWTSSTTISLSFVRTWTSEVSDLRRTFVSRFFAPKSN
jgi:hypothetical protein